MSLVEHAQVQNDASKHATLACSQEHTACDKGAIALDETHACAHDSPGQRKQGEIFATSDNLEEPVGRDIDEDIEDVEYGKRDVVFVASEVQVIDQAIDFGVANLDWVSIMLSTGTTS